MVMLPSRLGPRLRQRSMVGILKRAAGVSVAANASAVGIQVDLDNTRSHNEKRAAQRRHTLPRLEFACMHQWV
jgi:hypothetical protein